MGWLKKAFKSTWKGLGKAGKASYNAGRGILGLNQVKDSKELIKAQEQSQRELDAEARQANYEYGEMAADSAHDRSLALLQATTEANSLESKVADAKAAGLSPGLVLGGGAGGGGSAGGGAMGTGTRGPGGEAPNYLDIAAVKEQRRANQIEAGRVAGEQILARAEAAKIRAETERLKGEEEREKRLEEWKEAIAKEEAVEKWLQNNRTVWENGGSYPGEGIFTEKAAAELAEIYNRIETNKKEIELKTEEQKIAWKNLLNEIRKVELSEKIAADDSERDKILLENESVKTKAIEMVSKYTTGDKVTWKSAIEAASGIVKTISDIAK